MSRSIKKGPAVDAKLMKKVEAANASKKSTDKNVGTQLDYSARNGGIEQGCTTAEGMSPSS